MSAATVEERARLVIAEAIETVMGRKPEQLSDETTFEQLGMDALDKMEFVVELEERLDFITSYEDADEITRVGEIAEAVKKRISEMANGGGCPRAMTESKTNKEKNEMKYIRLNEVEAEPMKFGEFKEKFPKSGGANVERNAEDDGYVITYRKGEANEYVSWCPKAEFDAVSRPTDGMTFGMAIEMMKRGRKVARKGWNGKGMMIWLNPEETLNAEQCNDEMLRQLINDNGGEILGLGTICMYTHDSTGRKAILVGWLASQSDMICEDWVVVE